MYILAPEKRIKQSSSLMTICYMSGLFCDADEYSAVVVKELHALAG